MEILKNDKNLNIIVNTEQNFKTDLGWQENLMEFENEILKDIINPAINYETVRYIHKPYQSSLMPNGYFQSDVWFQFYFISGGTIDRYVLDYQPVGITTQENELMTKQSTESFFKLEFYKTPHKLDSNGNVIGYEPPTRKNRRLVNSRDLSLPLGEKFFYEGINSGYYLHVPIFTGSNYRNKENMYLFWFDDETALEDTDLSGTKTLDRYTFNNSSSSEQTIFFNDVNNNSVQLNIPTTGLTIAGWTGQTFNYPNISYIIQKNFFDGPDEKTPYYHGMNTFFMTAKFYDAKTGEVIDFTNYGFNKNHSFTEENDMYYQVDFNNYERTYMIYKYSGGTRGSRVGRSNPNYTEPINFYEKGGALMPSTLTPTPTPGPTYTPTPTPTSTPTSTPTNTPNIEIDPTKFYYAVGSCLDMRYSYTGYTDNPFGPDIIIPGCATVSQLNQLQWGGVDYDGITIGNIATTTIIQSSPPEPCGFGESYSGFAIARSSTEVPNGYVYNIGSGCYSVIKVSPTNLQGGWTIDLDDFIPVGIGDAACLSCNPIEVEFTVYAYSAKICNTNRNITVRAGIFESSLTIGNVYGAQLFSGNTIPATPIADAVCVTITANLGPLYTYKFGEIDPDRSNEVYYRMTDTGPMDILVSGFQVTGYTSCGLCAQTPKKYYISAERCDTNQYSLEFYSTTLPTINVGDSIKVKNIDLDHPLWYVDVTDHCWRVTQADKYRSIIYGYIDTSGWTIVSTGCPC